MKRLIVSATVIALIGPTTAMAQTAKDLVGTWETVSVTLIQSDGRKVDAYGPNPKGLTVFEGNGHFATVVGRTDLPKFASGNRLTGTADENKAVVQGSLAFFGTYAVTDKVIVLSIEGGTWPGWIGTNQRQSIASFTGDELRFTQQASAGGTAEAALRRVK